MLFVSLFLLASTGCDRMEDMEAAETLEALVVTVDTDRSPTGLEPGAPRPMGTLGSFSSSGTEVTLSLHPDPPAPGPLRLDFTLSRERTSAAGLSVDVVAPRMPAHGILRYPIATFDGDRVSFEVDIPMEGLWAIYLNLDHGPDAAAFEVEVEGDAEDGEHPSHAHQHHDHAGQH
ncbi:MAG: hypothetical protein EA421_12685 [Gemmatimonadales bacterium]|nr:MAG: hypothetical protein EA421_12685 [Gemmatimonadales bacterium]